MFGIVILVGLVRRWQLRCKSHMVMWLRHMKHIVVGLLVWLELSVWLKRIHASSSWIEVIVQFLVGLLDL